MADTEHRPAPSILSPDEAELLQHGGVLPPTQLGSCGRVRKFENIKPLGEGGMGHVYAATEPVTGTTVALKMLKNEFANDPRIVQIFLREAQHMYQLSHPSILKVLEVSGEGEGTFFVMPLVPGGSLANRISLTGVLDYGDTLSIGSEVAEGLAYAHSKGLIHRDLKPANVLLDDAGHALITDFGLVRSYLGDTMVDATRSSAEGTPAYMSPSVAAGQAEDTRCDIYAFGAMLYEMLAGHAPYQGRDAASVMQAVLHGPPQPLATVNPKAPKELVAISGWCMARELRDRYASMDDVLEDLNRVKAGKSPRGPHGSGIGGNRATRILLVTGGVLLVLAALAYGGWLVASRMTDSVERQSNKAARLMAAGDEDSAATIYHTILNTEPNNVQALVGLGNIEAAHGRDHQATILYQRARVAAPANPVAVETLISHLLERGHLVPARAELDHWLRITPNPAKARELLSRLETAEAELAQAHPHPRPGPPHGRPAPPLGEQGPPPREPTPPTEEPEPPPVEPEPTPEEPTEPPVEATPAAEEEEPEPPPDDPMPPPTEDTSPPEKPEPPPVEAEPPPREPEPPPREATPPPDEHRPPPREEDGPPPDDDRTLPPHIRDMLLRSGRHPGRMPGERPRDRRPGMGPGGGEGRWDRYRPGPGRE